MENENKLYDFINQICICYKFYVYRSDLDATKKTLKKPSKSNQDMEPDNIKNLIRERRIQEFYVP